MNHEFTLDESLLEAMTLMTIMIMKMTIMIIIIWNSRVLNFKRVLNFELNEKITSVLIILELKHFCHPLFESGLNKDGVLECSYSFTGSF